MRPALRTDARVADLSFRAHDALRERRRGREERARDFFRLQPQTSRSVSATCASGASAGWQQVKIRRRRSSSISSGFERGGFGRERLGVLFFERVEARPAAAPRRSP
jgi:hypothetical protein